MVSLSSHAELAAQGRPVALSPEPAGRWRWIGTRTLLFEPDERFPMATDYRVEVPAGTRTAAGRAIAEQASWTFATPPVEVVDFHPPRHGGPSDLEPILFARFNQRVDRQALLAHLELRARAKPVAVRLATDEEIEADATVRRLVQRAPKGQWIALRAVEPLPKDSTIVAAFKPGTPSAEGPRRTDREQGRSFRTYGPMRLGELRCHWGRDCPPLAPWTLELSNPIDLDAFEPSMVRVEPALKWLEVEARGSHITIRGRSKGRTRYTVTVSPELRDRFGQTLTGPTEATVDVGRAEPALFAETRPMVVLDPAFKPELRVYSVNRPALRVRLYRVAPEHYEPYLQFRRAWDWDQKLGRPPGRLVATRVVRPGGGPDELAETAIDLAPALQGGLGQVIAIVEPTTPPKRDRWGGVRREWVRCWVQATRLGLQAFVDATELHAWTSALADGSPVEGAQVGVLPAGGPTATTGADGMAALSLTDAGQMLVARKDGDVVLLPGSPDGYGRSLGHLLVRQQAPDELRWFAFDDRGLYQPGETVNVKGWVRVSGTAKGGDIGRLPDGEHQLRYRAYDGRGSEIAKGAVRVDESDGFHLSFALPRNANLGRGWVGLELVGPTGKVERRSHRHVFQVQEFRRPEYEVTTGVTEGPHLVGGHAVATVTAAYYAGGGLPDAEVGWRVRGRDAHYVPPGRGDYHFGKPPRWWWWNGQDEEPDWESWDARTGPGGRHRLRIDFDALEQAYARNLELEATVTDVNRQAWTSKASLLVHPASVAIGLRRSASFVRAGTPLAVDVLVSDLDGKAVEGREVLVTSARIETERRGGEAEEKEVDVQRCEQTSESGPSRCSFPTHRPGPHRLTAVVTDEHGRKSQTRLSVWVLGPDLPQNPELRQDQVDVVADKEQYAPGETAELLVMAPFAPAEGVLTLRRQGVVELRRFKMDQLSALLTVPVQSAYVPNITARVDLVGARQRDDEQGPPDPSLPKRPAFATGQVELKVPPLDRTLDVRVRPVRPAVKPGGKASIRIQVSDSDGAPVRDGRVALVVVDEAVLALGGYDLPDPLEVFYAPRPEGVRDLETRFRVALMRPEVARMQMRSRNGDGLPWGGLGNKGPVGIAQTAMPILAPAAAEARYAAAFNGGGALGPKKGGENGPAAAPIAVRADFRALAAFLPDVQTDAKGQAEVRIEVPDSLTRYRVMAVAASGQSRFGAAESTLTARLPLMVRPSLPRFLNYGDRFSLPVVLQNQTAQPLEVDVVARAANALLPAAKGQRVTVPPNDRVEVRFPAAAAAPGSARFQIGAVANTGTDASEHELRVWTPATTEAFATYGQLDAGAVAQPVRTPRDAAPQLGGLELTTSSTALQGLTDAVLYLVRYPFECNEQIASRVLGVAALRDVLTAFRAEGLPSPPELERAVQADIQRLRSRQHPSGGWDWWRRDRRPVPYVSIHVTHALVRAKHKRFRVPAPMLASALHYLGNIRHHLPHHYPAEVRRSLRAYALYVRKLGGDPDAKRARGLIAEAGGVERMPLESLGWLLPTLSGDATSSAEVAAIRRHLQNRVTETAGKAHFATSYREGGHLLLESSRRADAIVLEALIDDQPESDLVPKLVKGLLAHRKRGRWPNTQDNAFVLLALDKYFHTYETATPDFVARAWLGEAYAGEHTFKGRSTDRQHVDVPMRFLPEPGGRTKLVLAKQGQGRLYYRLGMQYAPKSLVLPPADHGFAVSRLYEAVEDPDDVQRSSDGTWRIKAGAMVRVTLTMVARARRYHVALVDPLPAGFEPLNPELATTASIPPAPTDDAESQVKAPWWWRRPWYEHQNMRDERVEAFASLLWSGVYSYSYVARATTPGTFVVPPAKAEEMYDPETFGRGPSDRVVIE